MVVHAVYSLWRGQIIVFLFLIFCGWLRTIRCRQCCLQSVAIVCYLIVLLFAVDCCVSSPFQLEWRFLQFWAALPSQGEAALSSQRWRCSKQDHDEGKGGPWEHMRAITITIPSATVSDTSTKKQKPDHVHRNWYAQSNPTIILSILLQFCTVPYF